MKTPEQQSSEHWSTVVILILNVLLLFWKERIHIRNEKNETFESLWRTLDRDYTRYTNSYFYNIELLIKLDSSLTI